jgi:hypothetical protein
MGRVGSRGTRTPPVAPHRQAGGGPSGSGEVESVGGATEAETSCRGAGPGCAGQAIGTTSPSRLEKRSR